MPTTLPLPSLALTEVIPLFFLVVTIGYFLFSAVLYYHWREYSVGKVKRAVTLSLYSLVTLPLWLTLGIITLQYYAL